MEEPNRIDILTDIDGLTFEEAWTHREHSTYGEVPIGLLRLEDLITAKRHAGRAQDQVDLEWLERARKGRPES